MTHAKSWLSDGGNDARLLQYSKDNKDMWMRDSYFRLQPVALPKICFLVRDRDMTLELNFTLISHGVYISSGSKINDNQLLLFSFPKYW